MPPECCPLVTGMCVSCTTPSAHQQQNAPKLSQETVSTQMVVSYTSESEHSKSRNIPFYNSLSRWLYAYTIGERFSKDGYVYFASFAKDCQSFRFIWHSATTTRPARRGGAEGACGPLTLDHRRESGSPLVTRMPAALRFHTSGRNK